MSSFTLTWNYVIRLQRKLELSSPTLKLEGSPVNMHGNIHIQSIVQIDSD